MQQNILGVKQQYKNVRSYGKKQDASSAELIHDDQVFVLVKTLANSVSERYTNSIYLNV